ncbi:uncharacterized protein LOC141618770 [Silene latifolia]|uniref:uncharacterized protein LOC141618770 n=1 Tax=Silene latifolia TaxID=37657 RepID=UPI003D782641
MKCEPILDLVTTSNDFHFHPQCKSLKLCHLCFADDLLMFCKGDTTSVKVLMRGFLSFSEASGLCFNRSKSDIYMNGVNQMDKDQILQLSGFQEGSFPFRYLGIPISYKRLSSADSNVLVDKIVKKIRGWGTKKLSYAGRLVLVRHVLSQMHSYWARIFLLPKGVMARVEAICRNYLWSHSENFAKLPLIAWDQCCLPQKYGGLGILNAGLWNLAMLAGLGDNCVKLRVGCYLVLLVVSGLSTQLGMVISGCWRLLTKDRMGRFGILTDGLCFLCGTAAESKAHLFFECGLSRRCLNMVQMWLPAPWKPNVIEWIIQWRCRSLLKKQVLMAAIAGLVYLIWESRNVSRVEHRVSRPDCILKKLQNLTALRARGFEQIMGSHREHDWFKSHILVH